MTKQKNDQILKISTAEQQGTKFQELLHIFHTNGTPLAIFHIALLLQTETKNITLPIDLSNLI